MRINDRLCPSGEVINALLPVLALHIHPLQVFPVFGKFSFAAFLLVKKACRFKGCPKGWPPKERPIESPRCKVTQMAVLGIHRDLSEIEVISRQHSGVHDYHLGTFLS